MMNSRFRVNLKFLQEAAEQAAGKEPVEIQVQEFNTILRKQIDLLNHYCTIKYEELLLEIQSVARRIKRIILCAVNDDPKQGDQELITDEQLSIILQSTQRQLSAAADDIVALELCIRKNFQLLIKAIIYFDTVLKTSASSWFMAQLSREWFANVNCDILLMALSLCWEKRRILEGREWEKDVKAWKPPESFVRNTIKYWIRPDKVAQCKASIVRHCPYLIFGYTTDELEFLIDPYDVVGPRPGNIEDLSDGQMVSSVYFDSACGYSYAQRIKRMEGAQLIRFRWYGENHEVATREEPSGPGRRKPKITYTADPQLEIFIERKTHHESWAGQDSIKERFSLPQKRVSDYMSNRLNIEQWLAHVCAENKLNAESKKIKNIRTMAREVLDCINEHELVPMLRTSYLRSAFQRSDRNDIRFSLDTNLCMVNEYKDPYSIKTSAAWCKTDNEILGNNEVIRFPYAVLEVKLQTEQPSWVSKMLHDCEAIMVFKFSKFQHGFAFLHRDKIPQGCPLPHWILDFEKKGFNTGFLIPSNKSCSIASTRNSLLPARGINITANDYKSIVYSKGRNVRKYDPKSILACERTLMHYCRKSLYAFGAGLVCFEFRWFGLGMILLLSSIGCVLYSFQVYGNRLSKIVNRMTKADHRERLDDLYAPMVAAGLISIGILSSLTIQFARVVLL